MTHSSPVPARLATAVIDMETAYTGAPLRANAEGYNIRVGSLGGLMLTLGLYTFDAA